MTAGERRPLVAGNWKMNGTAGDGAALAGAVVRGIADDARADVVLFPPFTSLHAVREAIRGGPVRLGAQNVSPEPRGAFTGEVSVAMLRDAGCAYVLVGHSERRTLFGETDEAVGRKAAAALDGGLCPVVCIGETLDERRADRTEDVLRRQVHAALDALADRVDRLVVAYEPVWAIGTGQTATPEQAGAAHAFVRGRLAAIAGADRARAVRILYGGSVTPANAADLFSQPDVDGGLVGGASLDPASFLSILRAV